MNAASSLNTGTQPSEEMPGSNEFGKTPIKVELQGIAGLPEIQAGTDIGHLLIEAIEGAAITLQDGDVLVLASKVVAKAEGRTVNLADVEPGDKALKVAAETGKDPRLVELILRESERISRLRPGLLIVRHRLGFTSANAGIDQSNVVQNGGSETVLLLPEDPDRSAARIREQIDVQLGVTIGVIIADSHGRPFRLGTVGVAVGVAGLPALWDRRGELDRQGIALQHTEVGTADEIAAAASLVMGQAAESIPAVHIRGLQLPDVDGRATDLIRPPETDVYL